MTEKDLEEWIEEIRRNREGNDENEIEELEWEQWGKEEEKRKLINKKGSSR